MTDAFVCSVCAAPVAVIPDEGPAFCEEHCPDHDYEYDPNRGCVTCLTCDVP